MVSILSMLRKWHFGIIAHAEKAGYPYVTFGIFGIITYPLYYLIWISLSPIGYENLYLRLIVVLLCIPLVFANSWPKKIQPLLPYFWYFTITYSLPFLFTFFLLKNSLSFSWILNTMTVVVLFVLLIDFIPLIITLPLGIALGYLCFWLAQPEAHIIYPTADVIISYSSVIIFGILFAHKKKQFQNEKLTTMRSLAGSIAHELRTPLSSIQAGAGGAKQYFSSLVNAYEIAKEQNLPIAPIPSAHLKALPRIFDNIELETQYSKSIINMILMNVKQQASASQTFGPCNIQSCIREALERYPFKPSERNLVQWQNHNDFTFHGEQALTVHILFNLLKNALYFIEAEKKGKIDIWCGNNKHYNILYFKDTAKGIPKPAILKLFSQFYSTTRHGTGLGLAYCKMVMISFGEDITCKSELNKYTQFEMYFPKISR